MSLMAKLPKEWRVYVRGEPEGLVRRVRPFACRCTMPKPWRERVQQRRRLVGTYVLWSLILISLVALGWRGLSRESLSAPPHPSTWPAEIRAKHQAAARSCDAARAAGLAPATKGYPGYWPHLDADNDGMSCEWSFGLPSISLRTLLGGD
jgi:hypothetical protein